MEYSFNKPRNEFEKLLKRAIKGEAKAQFLVGDCYYRGDGVEKDIASALNWYRKSALQEYPEALCMLGKCYDYGYGVRFNQREILFIFAKTCLSHNLNYGCFSQLIFKMN
ncbi:tetratricopeptide repeat protein [Succiniclasticum ruminis]|uniref:tetratricopeptide repeat protein n=1 Tax=Succiniclasticum ruminis TaxID=40841 RepID=UPI000B896159|nr:tetratricopeptide repeat protein [Succiniclasticum ruminis]